MTREEVLYEVCSIVALVYDSIGDYTRASDGFCTTCMERNYGYYENDGAAIEYVRLAVVAALNRDGYEIHQGFDPLTGKQKR